MARGRLRGQQGPVLAHRVSWALANGPIPHGQSVLHTCDVPACVNPDHLFLGTQRDNMRDAQRKGRLHVARPKRQQVPDAVVADIHWLLQIGIRQVAIARRFGVTASFVSQLKHGRRRQYDVATTPAIGTSSAAAAVLGQSDLHERARS